MAEAISNFKVSLVCDLPRYAFALTGRPIRWIGFRRAWL